MISAPNNLSTSAAAWHVLAEELADWSLRREVVRHDAYGGYRPQEEVGRGYTRPDGTKGKIGDLTTHKRPLTRERLVRHYRARARQDLVGLHSTFPDNTCLWMALDKDRHDEKTDALTNFRVMLG